MNRLNNKGYMLVEIILASVLAFGVAYFMMELIIKLKNKNDDLLVSTLMSTDQAIISKALIKKIETDFDNFSCDNISISDRTLTYGEEFIVKVNKYGELGSVNCQKEDNSVKITIPFSNSILKDEDFNVVVDYYDWK